MSNRPLFTILTATYNRIHTIRRVYESLQAQTCRDFEWLIIDDGSTDDTQQLVRTWANEAAFPIRYIRQPNQGQHMACNRGVAHARGELLAMIDSDDACTPDALAIFRHYWLSIPEDRRREFFGVGVLCQDEHGRVIGNQYSPSPLEATLPETFFRYHVHGQNWYAIRPEVLRRYPWAETPYKAPNPWMRIDRYKGLFVNEATKIYYQDDPESSLSRARATFRPRPLLDRQVQMLKHLLHWFPYYPSWFLRCAYHYTRCSLHIDRGLLDQWRDLPSPLAKGLWLATWPAGAVGYLIDRRRRTIKL